MLDTLNGFVGSTQMRTVPHCFHFDQSAVGQVAMDVLADIHWRDAVIGTLKNQGRYLQISQIRTIVREKSHASEVLCDFRIGAAEALCEFSGQLGTVMILHDY